MKTIILGFFLSAQVFATTISVIPVHEPISLHGTDVDEILSSTGEILQATVMPRPMALTGALPETIIEAMQTPHPLPSNNPNYKVKEANLIVLCHLKLTAQSSNNGLHISINIANLKIPDEVDLTARQLLKLTLTAIQRNIEQNTKPVTAPIKVFVSIDGTSENNHSLKDLQLHFTVSSPP